MQSNDDLLKVLKLAESNSAGYGQRTYHNAMSADVTIAFAVDFNTAGEKLTKKAAGAGHRYLAADMTRPSIEIARELYKTLRAVQGKTINVAGNGVYTLKDHGFDQHRANAYVFAVLAKVFEFYKFERVVSGGQTGIDLAGGVAGVALGLETIMTFPKGFLQRDINGKDSLHTAKEIRDQVASGLEGLQRKMLESVQDIQQPRRAKPTI